jgi:hypothetical protein
VMPWHGVRTENRSRDEENSEIKESVELEQVAVYHAIRQRTEQNHAIQ